MQGQDRVILNNDEKNETRPEISKLNQRLLILLSEANFRENWEPKVLSQSIKFEDDDDFVGYRNQLIKDLLTNKKYGKGLS